MTIDSSYQSALSYSGQVEARGQKPSEPIAPPGGNIENRQPPAEPVKPSQNDGMKSLGVGGSLDLQG
jgi:hypothetical protein